MKLETMTLEDFETSGAYKMNMVEYFINTIRKTYKHAKNVILKSDNLETLSTSSINGWIMVDIGKIHKGDLPFRYYVNHKTKQWCEDYHLARSYLVKVDTWSKIAYEE